MCSLTGKKGVKGSQVKFGRRPGPISAKKRKVSRAPQPVSQVYSRITCPTRSRCELLLGTLEGTEEQFLFVEPFEPMPEDKLKKVERPLVCL